MSMKLAETVLPAVRRGLEYYLLLLPALSVAQSTPVCNDYVQISLPGSCEVEILPDLILEGGPVEDSLYQVEIFSGVNSHGNTAHAGLIGLNLTVEITLLSSGEQCWGQLEVLDQWAPVFDCPAEAVSIFCGEDPGLVPPPVLSDNCDMEIAPVLLGQVEETPGCGLADGVWKKIFRYWGGADAWGNQAEPCQQEIRLIRGAPEDIIFPSSLDGMEAPALQCGETSFDPSFTGFPTLNGVPLTPDGDGACDYFISYSDIVFPGCGGSQKILRTWTIWDGCTPSVPGLNPRVASQVILLADNNPPQIYCPPALTLPILGQACQGPVELPALDIYDACSAFEVTMTTPAGLLEGNGGLAEGLAPGTYTATYTAIDDCGNTAVCELEIEVTDAVAPAAICDEYTVISLGTDGKAELPAEDLDDGSYDFCTDVEFLGRRMDSGTGFHPLISFNCADAGAAPVLVELQVTDAFGNAGYCMVAVTVSDKIAPVLECQAAVTLTCEQGITDLVLTGEPVAWDSCGYELGWSDADVGSNLCGWGEVVRTFQAIDPSGNSAICQQIITIIADEPFGSEGIAWPEDYSFPDCIDAEELNPDSLPQPYSRPVFADHPCALIAVNYEDAIFDVAAPACFKIVRTWRVIDWCQFDPDDPGAGGYWEHEQVLKVEDYSPPEIFCSFGSFMKITTPDCFGTVTLPPPTVKDCSPEVEIFVDSPFGNGYGPFQEVPLGSYPITYTVSDNCGNLASCSFTLQVVDAKKPTPLCDNGLVVELMQTGMVELPASALDEGSYDNCTDQEDLIFSFSPNPNDTTVLIDCLTPAGFSVQMWVFDESGNADYCQTIIFVQDNMDVCPSAPITLAGIVETETGEGVQDVLLSVNHPSGNLTATTISTGTFVFPELEEGEDYTLHASFDADHGNGLTTYDMVLIARHILGVQPLGSPYKIIAADVNRSNTVTTLDLVELRMVVLNHQEAFSNNSSWRFVDAAYAFPNPHNPFEEPFPEAIHYNNFTAGLPPASFIAIKVGDVNGSAGN
jgi:hypothetical protein